MQKENFYTVLMECYVDEKSSFVEVFWTYAAHIGIAIDQVSNIARLKNQDVRQCWAAEVDLYHFEMLPRDACEIDKTQVYSQGTRYYFPTHPDSFKWPEGVILSASNDDPQDCASGYECEQDDQQLYHLKCVPPSGQLLPVFIDLLSVIPELCVSWVTLSEEWHETDKRQLFTNEELNKPEDIKQFLQKEKSNIIQNGFVEFTAYSQEGLSNLLMNQHKEIILLSHDKKIVQNVINKLHNFNLKKLKKLKSIAHNSHWHYCPKGALNRNDLIAHLYAQKFSLWQEIGVAD